MENALEELYDKLIEIKKRYNDIQCAYVYFEDYENKVEMCSLPENYTEEELAGFQNYLNIEYNSGFGSQVLFGEVFFKDGSWLERSEDDGIEWWTHRKCEIPDFLKRK